MHFQSYKNAPMWLTFRLYGEIIITIFVTFFRQIYENTRFITKFGDEFTSLFLSVRINPGKIEQNTQIQDEEKKTGCRRDKNLLIFHMSKLNRQDEMQVGDSSGFRLRTSVVDWQGRASGKRGQDRQLQQDQGRQGAWGCQDEDDRWWRTIAFVNMLCQELKQRQDRSWALLGWSSACKGWLLAILTWLISLS